jgi:hypothetical protein
MKRIYFIFLALCFMYSHAFAQTNNVHLFEGELNFGITSPLGNYHDGDSKIGGEIGMEMRYNLPQTPFDTGLLLNITTAIRDFSSEISDDEHDQSNRTCNLVLVGDYNSRQGKMINPFVGLGIGAAFNDVLNDVAYDSHGISMAFIPRVGVEFVHVFRLTWSANISRKGYNNVALTASFVIGGWPRKK